MGAPRTTISLRVRSYEIRPDGRAGNVSFLNWFQESAFANSTELGYHPERYREMGVSWVMRESDMEILERPRFNEQIQIVTWVADFRRVQAFRQYEARRSDGTLLARCNTQWVMIDRKTQRPTRIPTEMGELFQPGQDFVLDRLVWPEIEGEPFTSRREVAFYEEDEMAHVNNANYLNWIEENARRAASRAGLPQPAFSRHLLEYRLPAIRDDRLSIHSTFQPHDGGLAWSHEVRRGEESLVRARSLST